MFVTLGKQNYEQNLKEKKNQESQETGKGAKS